MQDELFTKIELGEDTFLELKDVRFRGGRVVAPDGGAISDEMAAMANTASGQLVFGVENGSREIHGFTPKELDALETWVRQLCNDHIDPPLMCTIRRVPVGGGKGIVCVEIPRSVFVHKSAHGYFCRIGSSKRELDPDALARLFQQKSQSRIVCFDEQVVAQACYKDLKPVLYRRFRTPLSDANDASFLRKLHFVARDNDGTVRPTVSGILMACEHPEDYLPSAYIQAVAYRGKERTAAEQLDARDIKGTLDVQVAEAIRFVRRNMRIFAIKDPGRIDIPQYSLAAVFEALVNAVAHRDYSIYGAKIRLHLFADRLEIFSPGGLPNSLTLEELGERQFARNELLCSVLSRCKISERMENVARTTVMDRRGEGVPIILGEGEKMAGKRPLYEILNDAEVKLTLYAAPGDSSKDLYQIARKLKRNETENETEKVLNETESKRKETENETDETERLIRLMEDDASITQSVLVAELGVSRSWVSRRIAELKKEGRIQRIGADRGGYWKVRNEK